MKLEIKNISLKSVVFSAYPFIILALSLVNSALAGTAIDWSAGVIPTILQLLLWALAETMVIVIVSLIIAFVYNLFCSFGIRGIRFDIEEVEEKSAPEQNEAAQ
ncbi:MAG: hypothetical protein LBM71_04770 [Elusimicrobiota bacterium]|jgi:phosphotransferase system  glucose/maltose/N-acetylglucosamine-specific IIC component|nr:hypothetical protein [Elusimicrobiota bacterium]